jgi:hypothetical protein
MNQNHEEINLLPYSHLRKKERKKGQEARGKKKKPKIITQEEKREMARTPPHAL